MLELLSLLNEEGVPTNVIGVHFHDTYGQALANTMAALRDDVALPETSLRRRLVFGTIGIAVGVAAMMLGLFGDVPRGGYVLGAGTLTVLLGVTAVSPVVSRPFLAAAQATYRRLFGTVGNLAGQNSLRNPRRTTATASALMIGLALGSLMAIIGASAKASVDQAVAEIRAGA